MLAFGFFGESGAMDVVAWAIGMAAWIYIIYEIWFGDAKKAAGEATEGGRLHSRLHSYIRMGNILVDMFLEWTLTQTAKIC